MLDLFGLGKQQDPQEPRLPTETSTASESSASEPGSDAPAPRGSHKLWAFLLVLDSVFVIVFAGALAAKIYQYWMAPAVTTPAPRRRPAPVPAAAPVPVASTAPVPTPDPAKVPEPKPAPAASKPAAQDAPRPPKPSMLADAPRHRETPKPADAGGKSSSASKSAALPTADGKVKALRTEFRIHAPKAKAVELVGAFIVRGGRKDMTRQDDGTWTVTLYLNPGAYRYFFSVDKKKQLDGENPNSENGASLLTIP